MSLQCSSSSYATGISDPTIVDRNDCAVRAISVAKGIDYAQAQLILAAAGRQRFQGTKRSTVEKALGTTGSWEAKGGTLKSFVRNRPKGRFYVVLWAKSHQTSHAIAVVDGVVHNWGYVDGRTRVWWFVEIP